MRLFLLIIAGFVAGALLALFLCVAAGFLFTIPQFEGAYAMQVAFFWMPSGALVGAVLGLVVGLRRRQ